MKRLSPSILKLNQSKNPNAQTKEAPRNKETPQAEEATDTELTPQSGPSTSISKQMKTLHIVFPTSIFVARREYINLGPCQPFGHKYKRTSFEKLVDLEAFMIICLRIMVIGWSIVFLTLQEK
jgi:hypothetical protein